MKRALYVFTAVILLIGSNLFASDVSVDGSGNITTGTSNNYGNLKVTGASGEHAVAGETSGTGAAGAYGKNTDNNNYGLLGSDSYGVYGKGFVGYAGYFDGNARVTGDLTVNGSIAGETDPTVNSSVKDGVDWSELTGIPAGFADNIDNTGGSEVWSQSGLDIYYNSGNVGIGTSAPAGKLDVNGDLCLNGLCRTSWPTGSGTGAFTDTGTTAYYNGGNVGIGTASPAALGSTDTKVLHLLQPVASLDNAAAGVRMEIENIVNGGITSAYNQASGEGGVFVGSLSYHRVGFIANSMEKMSLTPDGNLGIGTTSPLQLLHVQGNAYISNSLGIGTDSPTNNLQVSGASALFSSDTGHFRLSLSKKLQSDIASIIFQDNFSGRAELGLTYDDYFHIKVSADGTTFTDALIVDNSSGNIGIGTSDTAYKLHVIGGNNAAVWAENTSTLPTLNITQYGTGHAIRVYNNNSGSGAALLLVQNGTGAALLVRNGSGEIMRVDGSGNVGIGTSTPQGKLDVNGPIYQRGGILHADYVFEPDYKLESIEEHTDFMWKNKHLASIPKAAVDGNGDEIIEVGSHRRGIVEELEKAHIYIGQLNDHIKDLNSKIRFLEERLAKIEVVN
ncbi:MAG: hypothetical protein AB1499_00215 [Nitrospirota bacterium]